MTQDGKPCAAAANGSVGENMGIQHLLYRRTFLIANVISLIAAGEKDAVGSTQSRNDTRIERGRARMEHNGLRRCHRSPLSHELLAVVTIFGIETIVDDGAQNQDVAAAGVTGNGGKGRIDAAAPAQQRQCEFSVRGARQAVVAGDKVVEILVAVIVVFVSGGCMGSASAPREGNRDHEDDGGKGVTTATHTISVPGALNGLTGKRSLAPAPTRGPTGVDVFDAGRFQGDFFAGAIGQLLALGEVSGFEDQRLPGGRR